MIQAIISYTCCRFFKVYKMIISIEAEGNNRTERAKRSPLRIDIDCSAVYQDICP